jgi:hypothetical protein
MQNPDMKEVAELKMLKVCGQICSKYIGEKPGYVYFER